METSPLPRTTPAIPVVAAGRVAVQLGDDELALGWECAHPALQIERWGTDEPEPPSSKS